jgi:cephalosporin-C deacetylase-like acetyl esterase
MDWSLHLNTIAKPFKKGTAEALPANVFKITIETADLQPGFYDIHISLDSGMAKPTLGQCTFGWKPKEMALRETRPADFKEYWSKAMAEYAAMPLDLKIEDEVKTFKGKEIDQYNVKSACLPPDYDPTGHKCEEVQSCKISFAGIGGGRVYAWLAKPKGNGPFPGMLVLPGGGFAARPRPLEHARHGYVAIDVQIHEQDVDLAKYPTLPGYYDHEVWEPNDKFYYRNVYLRAWRALDALCAQKEVDTDRIVVAGGSQGGRLSIVLPGMDKRIKAAVPCIPHCSNYPHLQWVTACNKAEKDGADLRGAPPVVETPDGRCMVYYDPMNFAPDVECPVFFNAGLTDPVSPPYSVWASFNRLGTKDKTITPLPGMSHDWSAEFDRRAWRWLEEKLGK